MRAFAPGIYPRSEALVQATRDLDRGRTSPEAVDEQLVRDRERLVAAQQAAGLDLLSDGMLAWQDIFRPLIEATAGLEAGALTRILDTNTFYRAPEASAGAPRLAAPLDGRHVAPLPAPRLVTLPSPYAFAHGTGLAPRALVVDLLRVDGVVDEREGAILLHAEEARAGGELPHVPCAHVNAGRSGLQHRDERRVPREHADLAGRAGHDQHHRVALERRPFGRYERDAERLPLVGHYAASASGSPASGSGSGSVALRP